MLFWLVECVHRFVRAIKRDVECFWDVMEIQFRFLQAYVTKADDNAESERAANEKREQEARKSALLKKKHDLENEYLKGQCPVCLTHKSESIRMQLHTPFNNCPHIICVDCYNQLPDKKCIICRQY